MHSDLLSEVLRKLRLRGAVYCDMECDGDFVVEAPSSPHAGMHIEYRTVLRGQCWCSVPGGDWVLLELGDVIFFPHGHVPVLASQAGMLAGSPAFIGPPPRVLCGVLYCDAQPFNPLAATLPEVLRVRGRESGNWIAGFLAQAVDAASAGRPGISALLERMGELMFLEALCRHTASQGGEQRGWLAGLQDRQVGRVLALIHEDPGHAWTGEELGARVGLSRSVLYERFATIVGQTPARYLINWRMQVAAGMLRSSTATVAAIACEVGYESEASFSRAFRRVVGESPAAWRRALTSAGSDAGSSGSQAASPLAREDGDPRFR